MASMLARYRILSLPEGAFFVRPGSQKPTFLENKNVKIPGLKLTEAEVEALLNQVAQESAERSAKAWKKP